MARLTPAVLRTLDILELFLDGTAAVSAADVVRETGLPRSTVHELLTTLTSRQYLRKDEDTGRYTLGVALLHLGSAYAERFDLLGAANVAARDLSDEVRETASVAIRQGNSVFYLAKIERRALVNIPSAIGQRLPASCTAVGKALLSALPEETLRRLYDDAELPAMTDQSIRTLPALLADLEQARRVGFAVEHEESTPGLHCVAALVRDVDGEPAAAISISVPTVRWVQKPVEQWAAPVLAAAAELSRQVGYRAQ